MTGTVFDGERAWSAAALDEAADRLTQTLQHHRVRVLATLLDNGMPWVVADRAAARAGAVHVPLPQFFTPAQLGHALEAAGVGALLTRPGHAGLWPQAPMHPVTVGADALALLVRSAGAGVRMPAGTAKITFTSGTTGTPKGVCLGRPAMAGVTTALAQALAPLQIERHLCALPLAVLLENIAGLDAALSVGATCVVPALHTLGWEGSSSFDVARFHAAVVQHAPHSLILLPQMLRAWTLFLQATGQRAPASLRFVAVGGAAVGAGALAQARRAGLPAYEGYGLSEGASVQTLNLPGADRPGSAGRALPHARLRIGADGEIEVAGSLFLGYLGDDQPPPAWWPTGDLGHVDEQGFLHVLGRKKHVLITAFGRNVSPEWVETELRAEPGVAQAVVLGDGQPALSAVLWPLGPQVDDAALAVAVAAANARLPDYARIGRWVRALAPFTAEGGLATANGRPRRPEIEAMHRDALGLSGGEAAHVAPATSTSPA